jgi:hypothetical protein
VASPAARQGSTGFGARALHPIIYWTLAATAAFLLALGIDLTLAPDRTDEFFSWPISPELTSQSIGAHYLTGFLLILITLKGGLWARGRTVILAGVVFSVIAAVATFIDLDRFNFDSDKTIAVVVTWVWILSYTLVPVILLLALIPQRRLPGTDPVTGPPPGWLRITLGVFGAIMVVVAAGLAVIPEEMAKIWPWELTPLTGRILGAWTAGFGVVLLWAWWENDRFRVVPAAAVLGLLGLFQLLTLARFGGDISWDEPGAWIYVAALAIALVGGALASAQLRDVWGAPTAGASSGQAPPDSASEQGSPAA